MGSFDDDPAAEDRDEDGEALLAELCVPGEVNAAGSKGR